MGEQKGDILFSGIRPTSGFLKRYTGDSQALSSPSHAPMPLLRPYNCNDDFS